MPVISISDLERISPAFKGKIGNLLGNLLLKLLSIDKINKLNDSLLDRNAPDFASGILERVGVNYTLFGKENIENLNGPFITISNHPYGAIDGISLIDIVGHRFPEYKVIVNKFLSCVKPLEPNFITVTPVTKNGTSNTKETINGLRKALEHIKDGHPLGIFPSGAVSDYNPKSGKVRDREWQMPIIRLIKKANVPIVPIRFFDGNSRFYYNLGRIDWRIRVLRLPKEVLNKSGKPVRIGIGKVISTEMQNSISDLNEFRQFLRDSVYGMELPE